MLKTDRPQLAAAYRTEADAAETPAAEVERVLHLIETAPVTEPELAELADFFGVELAD